MRLQTGSPHSVVARASRLATRSLSSEVEAITRNGAVHFTSHQLEPEQFTRLMPGSVEDRVSPNSKRTENQRIE